MDAIRFDALTKTLIAEAIRRRTLAGVLAGALGALGRAVGEDADAAKSGRCKKKCGECKFCKKGKCKPVERGTPCNGGDGNCICSRSIEGDPFCATGLPIACGEEPCANSGECDPGWRCIRCGGVGKTSCVPECGQV